MGAQSYSQIFSIPPFFCCQLSKEILKDPVTTKAGHTYEKAVLEDYFAHNGGTDPITKEKIDPADIFTNINLKQAIEEFVSRYAPKASRCLLRV